VEVGNCEELIRTNRFGEDDREIELQEVDVKEEVRRLRRLGLHNERYRSQLEVSQVIWPPIPPTLCTFSISAKVIRSSQSR
jgi:hypothetical protein